MRNRAYRAYVRSLPCAVCESRRGVEAAHTGPRGLSTKSSDFSCIPLCRLHHKTGNDSLHSLGPRKFADAHSLDVPALIARLNEQIPLFGSPHRFGKKERSPEFTRYHCSCGWRTTWYRSEFDGQAALHYHMDKAPISPGAEEEEPVAEASSQIIEVIL